MKTKTLTALAFAGTLALGACGGKVENILDGKEPQEPLFLTGIVERIRVDVKNKGALLYLNVPLKRLGNYELASEQWPNDTAKVELKLSYNELVSLPAPLGVGDLVDFELRDGFEKRTKFVQTEIYGGGVTRPFWYLTPKIGGHEGSITSYEKTAPSGAKK